MDKLVTGALEVLGWCLLAGVMLALIVGGFAFGGFWGGLGGLFLAGMCMAAVAQEK